MTTSHAIFHGFHKWILSLGVIKNHEMSEEMVFIAVLTSGVCMWWHLFYCDLYAPVNLHVTPFPAFICARLLLWAGKTQIPKTTPHHTVMKIKVKKWRMARHPGVSSSLQKISPLGILCASCQKCLSLLECKTELLLFLLQMGSFSQDWPAVTVIYLGCLVTICSGTYLPKI